MSENFCSECQYYTVYLSSNKRMCMRDPVSEVPLEYTCDYWEERKGPIFQRKE